MCVDLRMACDGREQCDDGSDEIDGCNIYADPGGEGEEEERCPSWNGRKHVPCLNSTVRVCTLEELASSSDVAVCRTCDSPDEWRCNDGFCIPSRHRLNGLRDCPDGSDEKHGEEGGGGNGGGGGGGSGLGGC